MPTAWVVEWNGRWLDFDPNRGRSWPCTNMGDARFFNHPQIAKSFVTVFCDDRPGCEVREVRSVDEETD